MKTKTLYKEKKDTAFILPFSVMLASIVLGLGFTIFNVAYKEFFLTTITRDSEIALYAADTGIECALYWDLLASGSLFPSDNTSPLPASISCAGGTYNFNPATDFQTSANSATTTFSLTLSSSVCSSVMIAKTSATTTVNSRGYNRCGSTDARRLERAIQYRY